MSKGNIFQERRKRFLINKPLQLRYMAYISGTLFVVAAIVIGSLYFGIWGGILDAFSDNKIRDQLLIASRISEYETARIASRHETPSLLGMFKQSEKLSQRQREIFKDILNETNKQLVQKLLFLVLLIGWGSIYLSHKVAGPLYRFHSGLKEIEEGDLSGRIKLRQTDEAHFIASQFNQTVEHLDRSIAQLKNIVSSNKDNPEQMQKRLLTELEKYKNSANK